MECFMAENETKQDVICSEVIDYARHLFDRHAIDFDTLDKKALGSIGIAGLLVGFQAISVDATVELIQCFRNEGCCSLPLFSLIFLVIHAGCLVISIWKSLATFQVREFDYPASVKEQLKGESSKVKVFQNIIDAYDETTTALGEINYDKAAKLKSAVWLLTFSILSLIPFLLFMIISKCK